MTNREKWIQKVEDKAIEYSICSICVNGTFDLGYCPECPINSFCREYINGELTETKYMAKITEWLDEEVKEYGSV